MYTLILDTSTERGFVSIVNGTDILFVKYLPSQNMNSRTLFSGICEGLDHLQITPKELAKIAVASGPGSFTGTRVAASAAKGMALGLPIPLIGFSTLSGFVSEKEGRFASLIDAKMSGAYVLIQENRGGVIREISEPTLCPLDQLESKLADCECVVGPALTRFSLKKGKECLPDISHLATLVDLRYRQGHFSMTADLDLIYLRKYS